MTLYSIRWERQFCERLQSDVLFLASVQHLTNVESYR